MENLTIEQLENELGIAIRWYDGDKYNLPGDGWLLIEVNPLPPLDKIEFVAADLAKGSIVRLHGGKLYHFNNCIESEHYIKNAVVRRALKRLTEQTFTLAIYPGQKNVYNGQPIIISLEPEINYMVYPDHPHLIMGLELI